MAHMAHARSLRVMAAVGVLAALIGVDAAAQDTRQTRTIQLPRVALQTELPELILLPEPVPLPLRLPTPSQALPQAQDVTPPAQVAVTPPPAAPPAQAATSAEASLPQQPLALQQMGTFEPTRRLPEAQARRTSSIETLPADQEAVPLQQEMPAVIATFQSADAFPNPNPNIAKATHPAVGAWFGQAIQICPAGVAPSACNQGTPSYTLFMTPTLLADGLFVADDTAALGGPPDGPHTTAFGSWVPTSETEFTADYLFMTIPFPYAANALAGLRARWVAKVIDADTMVGWVNAYLMPKTPITWKPLQFDEFPTLPAEALQWVTSPNGFVLDPATCRTPGCPVLVLKFTVKRIRR